MDIFPVFVSSCREEGLVSTSVLLGGWGTITVLPPGGTVAVEVILSPRLETDTETPPQGGPLKPERSFPSEGQGWRSILPLRRP